MKAIQYARHSETPVLVDIPRPPCPADGVLIEVRATGVCRSDWHAWQGHDPVALPHIPGHEFAGVIAEVGRDVVTHGVGERVTAPFVCGCGRCAWCADGNAQVCPNQSQPGFTMPGSFAELVAVPAADLNIVRLPDELDFVTAASLGCRFATAYRALTAHGRVGPGDRVSVFGCGGLGLSAVMIAAGLGATVVAVDSSPVALERARQLGAAEAVAAGAGAVQRVRDVTGGGSHVSMDAVGSAATAAASVASLRPRGRHLQVGLLLGDDADPALPLGRVIADELEIYGSHGMAARDYPEMLAFVLAAGIAPERLIGDVIGLAEAGHALAAMSRPPVRGGITVVAIGNAIFSGRNTAAFRRTPL